jgi:hypothetical protein
MCLDCPPHSGPSGLHLKPGRMVMACQCLEALSKMSMQQPAVVHCSLPQASDAGRVKLGDQHLCLFHNVELQGISATHLQVGSLGQHVPAAEKLAALSLP